jgi:hypothetical protein
MKVPECFLALSPFTSDDLAIKTDQGVAGPLRSLAPARTPISTGSDGNRQRVIVLTFTHATMATNLVQ